MPAPRETVLSERELNRATLARQLLLGRARVPAAKAVERLGGLQAQEPAGPFVALWSRLDGFDPTGLRRAAASGAVVKATLMRGTLHLVTADDWAHFQPVLASGWAARRAATPAATMAQVTEATLAFAQEPRSQAELRAFVAAAGGNADDGQWWQTRGQIPLLHVPTGGTWSYGWRPRQVAAPPQLLARLASPEAGARRLVLRHLAAFGPATVDDVLSWSKAPAAPVRAAIEALGAKLERLRDEDGRELLDVRRGPRPGDVPAPPRFLSMWDSALLAFRNRARLLDGEHFPTVVNKQGDHRPTFLVDGRVGGLWRTHGGRVELLPFAPLPRSARRELEDERRRLEAWLAPLDPSVFSRYTGKLTAS